CRRLRTNALAGHERGLFCVEACEYDRSFLHLSPFGAIVTNVEEDHLDYYGTFGAIKEAFARFADRVAADGLLVLGPGWATPPLQLAIPGHFSVENAACALALAIGVSARRARVEPGAIAAAAAQGIERFAGVE